MYSLFVLGFIQVMENQHWQADLSRQLQMYSNVVMGQQIKNSGSRNEYE
jgi:hypothetical protein